jgi:hypothetical protein
MQGQFSDTDALIEEAMPEISVYEMLSIKKMGEQLVKDSNGTINPQEVNRGLK